VFGGQAAKPAGTRKALGDVSNRRAFGDITNAGGKAKTGLQIFSDAAGVIRTNDHANAHFICHRGSRHHKPSLPLQTVCASECP